MRAIISSIQRAFDGKFLSRVEVMKGAESNQGSVVFITEAKVSLEESRVLANDYTVEMGYVSEIDMLIDVFPEVRIN